MKKPDFFTDKSEKVRLSSFADQTLSRAVALSLAANVPPSDILTLRPLQCIGGTMVWYGMVLVGPLVAFVAQAINDGEPGDGEVRGKD